MTLRIVIPSLIVCLVGFAGCGNSGTSPGKTAATPGGSGGVGVVDLDAVAKALGRDLEMESDAEKKLGQFASELSTLQTALNRQLQEKVDEVGEAPTDDERKALLIAQRKLDNQFRESKSAAERKLVQYKQKLVTQFREETKPIVREIAAQRGLSIVVPKDPNLLLTVASEVDLTDAVVLQMQNLAKSAEKPQVQAKPKSKTPAAETSSRDD